MPPITLMERLLSIFVTALSAAAMALLGLDVLWLMDETLPITGRPYPASRRRT